MEVGDCDWDSVGEGAVLVVGGGVEVVVEGGVAVVVGGGVAAWDAFGEEAGTGEDFGASEEGVVVGARPEARVESNVMMKKKAMLEEEEEEEDMAG